ncbi:MAG: heme-binding protein [Candidatus Tectomicrobia bacterium]|uniref:Heme-binding protein n=1 Tax=Tectimicrobiota bacterium TaxID=2528274 RepID=A0A937W1T8_UNCTE|nr:heme-binding protein [Candidatus Tectomicrobia bacterium]
MASRAEPIIERSRVMISMAETERILQAAKQKALEMGVKVGISIVDARGDLVAMLRLDGALWRTAPVSRGKAYASAAFGLPSADLTERANNPVMRALMQMEDGQIIPQQGALPIRRGNELLGAIGVSGATSQEDEDVARAGLAAL